MAGMSRYERVVLGLTAAFVLFTGGWFLARRQMAQPYQVITETSASSAGQQAAGSAPSLQPEQPEERPDSLMEGEVIDINTADLHDLQRLPGIGEKRAQAIMAYREEHGPFQSVDELDNVEGIGEGILSGLREYARVTQEPEE